MTPLSSPPGQMSLLLVGIDPLWLAAAEAAAMAHGALLEVRESVDDALASMLRPARVHTHVLAIAPVAPFEVDALAGMLDEVTLQPTRLLLLGSEVGYGNMVQPVMTPSHLAGAIAQPRGAAAGGLLPLAAGDLAHALHRGNLRMRFQPFVRADTLAPVGMEALARLHHPQRGILHPREFIPLAVASRQESVLTAIATARTVLELGHAPPGPGLVVSLNVPLPMLLAPSAISLARELCAVAGMGSAQVMIEVVETLTRPDLAAVGRALEQWRAAGFRLAIDDAGPALPHWRDLLALPFDTLKLDGAIVDDVGLTASIVEAAKAAGLFVIAEGIESEAAMLRLRELGADALQGFLFSRPLPAVAVPLWMVGAKEAVLF